MEMDVTDVNGLYAFFFNDKQVTCNVTCNVHLPNVTRVFRVGLRESVN